MHAEAAKVMHAELIGTTVTLYAEIWQRAMHA